MIAKRNDGFKPLFLVGRMQKLTAGSRRYEVHRLEAYATILKLHIETMFGARESCLLVDEIDQRLASNELGKDLAEQVNRPRHAVY